LRLFHLDLYRLETLEQIITAGLEEYLQPDGVAVIEWAERWVDCGSQRAACGLFRRTAIEVLGETERRITYEDSGA